MSSENETQRSVKATFALPSGCVNDLYQLSILLKTVMTEGGVLSKVGVSESKPTGLEELIHPAVFGYEHQDAGSLTMSGGHVNSDESPTSRLYSPQLRPLRRKSAVEIERLDSNTRSPIFFGKEYRFKRLYELSGLESKRNNPRGTSRVDSTKADILPETQPKQVVWQQQEHIFVYNHLTSTGSSVELKNQVKAIGVGLALVEITPLLRLPNGSASTLSENENAPRAPILVTNTLASVKADVAALERRASQCRVVTGAMPGRQMSKKTSVRDGRSIPTAVTGRFQLRMVTSPFQNWEHYECIV